MMNDEEYSSDSSDEDYVPEVGEQLSEEEDSGDEEDFIPGGDDNEPEIGVDSKRASASRTKAKCVKKSKRSISDSKARKRKGGIKLEGEEPTTEQVTDSSATELVHADISKEIATAKKEETSRKRADDLWADFMKDVGGNKNTVATSSTTATKSDSKASQQKADQSKPATVKVTKEYDFAGETVTVVKEVLADSKEARLAISSQSAAPQSSASEVKCSDASTSASINIGVKRPATGGLSSVLGKIGKKEKMGVLEKSKLDWDGFKVKEGIAEELKTHNRGKAGYLERQAFLERADYRQFEIERDLRQRSRPSNSQPSAKP